MPARSWSSGRAAFALALLVLALFRDLVFRGRVLFDRDVYFFWFGQVEVFRQCLHAGSWPVWDRTMAFGQPLLANPGVEAFYPWTWLSLIMDPWSFFTVFVLGHLMLSALGFAALARRFEIGPVGATVAAAVWITSGPMMSFVNLWHHLAGAALMPWVVVAADVALRGGGDRRWRGVMIWGGTAGLQLLAGSADMCVLTTVPVALLMLARVEWRRGAGRANAALAATALIAGAFAVALAAAQWFPTLSLAAGTLRLARLAESARTTWSVHPRALPGLVVPVFPGELPLGGEPGFAMEAARPFVASLYLGLTALPLVAAAFGGIRRRLTWIVAAMTAGALVLALGRHTFVYPLVVRMLPLLASFRYPSKAMVLVAFGWSGLVALGLERLELDAAGARRRAAVVALGMGLLAAVLLASSRGALAPILAPAGGRLTGACLLALLLAALSWRGRGRGARAALAMSLGAVALADLFIAHQALNRTIPRAEVTQQPEVVRAILAARAPRRVFGFDYSEIVGKSYRRPPGGALMLAHRDDSVASFAAYREYGTVPVIRAWGIGGSFDNDPQGLYPGYLTQLVTMFRVWEETPVFVKALRLASVGHVIALHREGLEALVPEAEVQSGFPAPIRLFRVPDPLPACNIVAAGPVAVDSHQLFVILADPRFDPAREVLLPPGTPSPATDAPVRGDCRPVDVRPDRGRYEVELSAPGYVVLADTFDRGWRAALDGRGAEVIRANVAFQAVAVPAGRHVLELVYRPDGLIAGLWVSGLALVVLLAGGGYTLAAGRRRSVRDTIGAVSIREP